MASQCLCRWQSIVRYRSSWQSFRAATTATSTAAKTATPAKSAEHLHVRLPHIVTGKTESTTFRLKPEMREASLLQLARKMFPQIMQTIPGLVKVPGPRNICVENQESKEFTNLMFLESLEGLETFKQTEEYHTMMGKWGECIDVETLKQEEHSSDYIYCGPMTQCNVERYPIAVGVWFTKPGCRKFMLNHLASSQSGAEWLSKHGCLFIALTWNEAEDKCVSYSIYKDLLSYDDAVADLMNNRLREWGVSEFLVEDDRASLSVHTNSWVYSE